MALPYDRSIADIAYYVFHYEIDDNNNAIWKRARMALLDTLGCAIETAAISLECRNLLDAGLGETSTPHGFRVPGTDLQVDPVEGTFAFGALIRYLDHNDALGGVEWGHPSDNLASILAVMDWLSRASVSGTYIHKGPPLTLHTLLIALTKAYEIQGCYQMGNSFNAYGIDHVVLVKLASTATVSWLLGLTEEEAMASISHVWLDGQPTRVYRSRDNTIPRKGWAAADAARRGVQLALYVRAGQPGAAQALSAKPWGFWSRTFGEQGFHFPQPFGTWTIQNVLFKTVPVEGHAVSAVEAALIQLRRFQGKALSNPAAQIQRIELRTTAAANLIINKTGPLRNAADRDHCLQYVVALTILKGAAPDTRDYLDTSPWTTCEYLTHLRDKILVVPDHDLTQDYLNLDKKSIANGLTVIFNDGSVFPEVLVEFPVGHMRHPKTETAVEAKFQQNMAHMFSRIETAHILEEVQQDDMLVHDFVDLLARPTADAKL
ncbi:uncharacterized protein N7477_009802 [Penicillium maclennaniae]|uniref:uncharacterized protein n=1 Tax=Penicillium maclennaniae TaxID=1343394 RepID=UPI002541594D|nr:uncharacterized protein N7477_009802 [Penicillium maclennaniae]KAJ5662186.1 hypothetical protein N7477_009802 [Penicillium maclennaniae]